MVTVKKIINLKMEMQNINQSRNKWTSKDFKYAKKKNKVKV